MKLLAIDTATEKCSVAVRAQGETTCRAVLTARNHAELVLPMVGEVLAAAGLDLGQLDGLAFGRGPGAFTGVRIAAGVVQGLALGSGLPVAGISNLAAVAQQVAGCGGDILVCMDARMREVYWGLFRTGENGLVVPVAAERVSAPAAVELPAGVRPVAGLGTGFRAWPELKARFPTLQIDDAALPDAREIALLGEAALLAGAGRPAEEALPVYLRDEVAWARSP